MVIALGTLIFTLQLFQHSQRIIQVLFLIFADAVIMDLTAFGLGTDILNALIQYRTVDSV